MVMHARKPQRMSDGYFEKHQSHSYQSSKYSSSKRDYDREASSRSNYRERDNTPTGGGGGSLNNGNSSYRSQSPEIDSPSSRHDIRGDRDRDRDRFSYIQKMRDRDRDVYKKDKYSDKRDRRGNDRETEHRTNHDRIDRRAKLCSSSGDKRSGSDDRDRDRDRELRDSKRDRNDRDRDRDRERDRDRDRDRGDRDRDRERERNDRGDRASCASDWSEHVSSSGKMYYYNCKTEKSQWEKPKEWIEKERNLARDQHREKDYREKERERDREERFSRSAYTKHSSSRGNSRLRWGYDNDGGGPPAHRRRIDENPDMDISPGDSTPTSEASYSLTGTPTTAQLNDQTANLGSAVTAGGAATVLLPNALPRLASHPTNASVVSSQMHFTTTTSGGNGNVNMGGGSAGQSNSSNHRKLESVVQQVNLSVSPPNQTTSGSQNSNTASNQNDHHLNSNAPGPPKLGTKSMESIEMNSQQKGALLRQAHGISVSGSSDPNAPLMDAHHSGTVPGVISLRDNPLNSPHYNLSHAHGMSPLNYTKSPVTGANNSTTGGSYPCNTQFGLKTVEGVNSNIVGCPTSLSNASLSSSGVASGGNGGHSGVEGPPTPTQELDISGNSTEQRKLEGTSASLSTLQSCVATAGQAGRAQGPDLSPKLAKYFRADLITHVTNWPADILEKQAQKCSEETHAHGDLLCTKVSAELKSARSLVRITEITATLQEQKIMYLRQQIRLLEELRSQNSFMSDDL